MQRWFRIVAIGLFVLTSGGIAVPPAQAASPDAALFGQLPQFYDAAVSPDGKNLAAIVNVKSGYAVAVFDFAKTKDISLVNLGSGVKPLWVKWANDDMVLVSLWQSERIARTPITTGYIYTIDMKNSKKPRVLVKPEGQFRQYNNVVVDFLEDDPEHILMAYSTDGTNNSQPDLRKVNIRTRRDDVVHIGRPNVQTWYTDQTGAPRIGQGLKDKSTEQWVMRIREAGDSTWRYAKDYPGLNAKIGIHGFTNNPNEVIISDYQGKNTRGIYVYDLSMKSISRKIFHNEKYDARGVILSKDGSKVMGASYTADSPQVELFGNYETGYTRLKQTYSGANVDFVDISDDGNIGIFKVSYPHDPGSLIMTNERTGAILSMGEQYPGLKPRHLGEVISVRYSARDGVKIPSYVTLPPTITDTRQFKKLPFIVLPHGGPYSRDYKRFDYFAQFFASRGFGVLQMNFRGSSGYGKNFKDSGRKNWVVMQEDVEDGTRWLIEKGYADPKRTCIAGWSYGGYAALMGALKNDDLYACAISMAGVTDLQNLIRDEKKYRFGKVVSANSIISGFEGEDDIRANSPQRLAEDLKIPLFLAHGTKDQRVHFDHFSKMKNALKKSSADVTYMKFKDEDHFLSNQENRTAFFIGLDVFLKKHIGKSEFSP